MKQIQRQRIQAGPTGALVSKYRKGSFVGEFIGIHNSKGFIPKGPSTQ